MTNFKNSETKINLMRAFAGESQARNKYDYFPSKAKKDGYEQIAAIFAGLFLTDRIRRVIPAMALLTFPMGLFFAGLAV